MTILLFVHNERKHALIAINHIRKLIKQGKKINFIVIDNASTDELSLQAIGLKDFTYINIYQNIKPWGMVLKNVLAKYPVDDEIVIMKSNILPVTGCLNKMSALLVDDCVMSTCLVANSGSLDLRPKEDIKNMDEAINYMNNYYDDAPYRTLNYEVNIFMIKKKVLESIEIIDSIYTMSMLTLSLLIQIIQKNYSFKLARNAVAIKKYDNADFVQYKDNDRKILENKFGIHYFSGANPFIQRILDTDKDSSFSIMEVGCDSGATLLDIKNKYPNSTTIGCDINENIIEIAKHCVDKAFVANIETDLLNIEQESLDYIFFGDVLEHLHDPVRVLRDMHKLLKPNGKILASIPNVMHIFVISQLLHGYFSYQDYGLLDKTHVHLFTFKEIQKIFSENGYEIEVITYVEFPIVKSEEVELIDTLMTLNTGVDRFMFEAYQYQVRARKV